MSKLIDIKGTFDDMAADLADKMEGQELPLVRLSNASVRCTDIIFQTQEGEKITENERLSINALLCWVAVNNNFAERTITECLKDELGVARLEDIPAEKYDDAVKYLVEFECHVC